MCCAENYSLIIKNNHHHYLLFLPPFLALHCGLGLFVSAQEEACKLNNEDVKLDRLYFCPLEGSETWFVSKMRDQN